ncbi:hypothetical protein F4680DRAFT_469094 [Xylaria scruposa]|nr:hypothetical protein F4680DRAFT_469094 [Xylaria scruposa]
MLRLIVVEKLLSDHKIEFAHIKSGHETPKYAVACWAKGQPEDGWTNRDDEFTYQKCRQFEYGKIQPSQQLAFGKLTGAAKVAKGQGCDYIWIDHCCIDQSNAKDVEMSINLRYQWYAEAEVCLVYLPDGMLSSDPCERLVLDVGIRVCRWFYTSWSTAVMLASKHINFYDRDWQQFGTIQKQSSYEGRLEKFENEIQVITSIHHKALSGSVPVSEYSVAARISWARGPMGPSDFEQVEDLAYSLVGLFGVHLTPNYGEGGNMAFHRLAAKIMQSTSDLSILSWEDDYAKGPLGALPYIPLGEAWGSCYNEFFPPVPSQHPLRMTEKGVRVTAVLYPVKTAEGDRYWMPLGNAKSGHSPGLLFQQIDKSTYQRTSKRRKTFDISELLPSPSPTTFHITTLASLS